MRKYILGAIILLMVVSLGVISCAAPPPAPKVLKEPEVSFSTVDRVFLGTESVCIGVVYTVKNPNDFIINLESLEYEVYAGGMLLNVAQATHRYVPAKGQIDVRDYFVLVFTNFFAEKAMGRGLAPPAATAEAATLWKGLAGKKPAMVPEALWGGIPEKKLLYSSRVKVFIDSEAGAKAMMLDLTYER